jgi:tetratricopeptide (TPR) repeat protein
MYEQQNDYNLAKGYYLKLYEHTKKIDYLKKLLDVTIKAKEFNLLKDYIKLGMNDYPKNEMLKRAYIRYLLFKKDYQKSKELTFSLIKSDKNVKNYEFAGSVFLSLKQYKFSLKYFERAYGISYNEDILSNIADILYLYLNRKDEAIAYLETHIRIMGCSKKICYKLLDIYGREKDINGLISVYKRLYFHTKDKKFAKKVVELLMYQGERKAAIKFLKKSDYDDKLLIDIYISMKDFKNAYKTAKLLYKKDPNPSFLGKMAIYQYEGAIVKNKKLLLSVSKKFEKAIHATKNPLYLNYYGYLLIDYNLNIKKGIKLVKEALKHDPDSPYYLDSLAWGYYKLGLCKKAKKIMSKVLQMTGDSEVKKHDSAINECIKKKEDK